jgi:hypothetical protein
MKLQIPATVIAATTKSKMAVLYRTDGTPAILHDPHKLADHGPGGQLRSPNLPAVA